MPFISTGSGGNKVVPFYGGGQVPNPANVIVLTAAPSSAATGVAVGTIAVNTTASSAYMAVKNTGINGTVTWAAIGGATTDVNTLTPDSGTTPVVPTGGTISLKGTANQITSVGGTNQITFALASALTAPGSVTATTTLTATLGNITATNGNLVLGTAGNKISSTSVGSTTTAGANSFGTVALVAGTATVATTAVTANSMIFLQCQALGTVAAAQAMAVTAKTAATSFVITSADATDTSTVAWFIVN